MYKSTVPLTHEVTNGLSLSPCADFGFAASLSRIEITLPEALGLASFYPIAVERRERGFRVVAILAADRYQPNGFVDAVGRWRVRAIPEAVRLYPFRTAVESGSGFHEIDVASPHVRLPGGACLWETGKRLSGLLARVRYRLHKRQSGIIEARRFAGELFRLGLIEPVPIHGALARGGRLEVRGYWELDIGRLSRVRREESSGRWSDGENLRRFASAVRKSRANLRRLDQGRRRPRKHSVASRRAVGQGEGSRSLERVIQVACMAVGTEYDERVFIESRTRPYVLARSLVAKLALEQQLGDLEEIGRRLEKSPKTVRTYLQKLDEQIEQGGTVSEAWESAIGLVQSGARQGSSDAAE